MAEMANMTPVMASQSHRYGQVLSPLARWYAGWERPRISALPGLFSPAMP
jgi:hypothetical protein